MNKYGKKRKRTPLPAVLAALGFLFLGTCPVHASTYVVYIPLDSPIYSELDQLNALGYLDSYLEGIKPISRVEAARLTLEAQRNYQSAEQKDGDVLITDRLVQSLRMQLHEEVRWLESNRENNQPNLFHPIQRMELQYVFSRGEARQEHTGPASGINFNEATPLMPNNDALPTSSGSNEIARVSGWAGFGDFLTLYGEGAASGPFTRGVKGPPGSDVARFQPLGAEAVVSLGNFAISFGQQEMWWGMGTWAPLSQGDNAAPFPALRFQGIHPTHLPGILRYLGLFRWQVFFGQLDEDRVFRSPWIDGQNFDFKPLPDFEFGFTHAIEFGGYGNDHYNLQGFLGRASGFATGSPTGGNTNSRGGVYFKYYIPKWRNLQIYFELLGEDNLTGEVPGIGRFMPFLAVSYQGGFYLPRLTHDGLTDARFEWTILEPNYSQHSDSLYWTYNDRLMADPMGPNATRVDFTIGRWIALTYKADVDIFYTERAPIIEPQVNLRKERSLGGALDLWSLPVEMPHSDRMLADIKGRTALEYVHDINFLNDGGAVRALFSLTFELTPGWNSIRW
ncbi:MAG: capsule assembly Wzi family protein [Candidatus Binataceae bacterium]